MSVDSYDFFEEFFSAFGGADAALAGVVGVVLIVAVIIALVALAFAITAYILNGIALSAIAKRRNIRNSWLAWVPVGSTWLMGCIADQYQYVVNGKITKRRTILLWLSVASFLLAFSDLPLDLTGLLLPELMVVISVLSFFIAMASWAVSIALAIFTYIALYDLFRSCNPKNAVLYLVLSIVFNITQPIFLFINRNKDLGMQSPEPKAENPAEPEIPGISQPEETNAQ